MPVQCRYCGETFGKQELRSHLIRLEATCQLEQPLLLGKYLHILQEQTDETRNVEEDVDDDDEETSDKLARPLIGSAFTAWTEVETERFFEVLPRFSKFRCDAIAEHIQTKSESEVLALIGSIEDNIGLMQAHGTLGKHPPAPAAREMSERWIEMEERLAEDVIVWEAFVEQAQRTPFELRDPAQHRFDNHHLHIHCLACTSGTCDGTRPRCIRCRLKKIQCTWPGPAGPILASSEETPA